MQNDRLIGLHAKQNIQSELKCKLVRFCVALKCRSSVKGFTLEVDRLSKFHRRSKFQLEIVHDFIILINLKELEHQQSIITND